MIVNSLLKKTTTIFLLSAGSSLLLSVQTLNSQVQNSAGTSIAVLDFGTAGAAAEPGESAAEIFRARLAAANEFAVVDRKTMQRSLRGRKPGLNGALGKNEAAALGRLLAVKELVAGSLVKADGMYTLTVHLIEAETGQVLSGKIITARSPDFCLDIAKHVPQEGLFHRPGVKTPAPAMSPAAQTPAKPVQPAPAEPVRGSTALPTGDITYEQVLERPDDLALNYAYARTKVRKGELKGAAVTLERMLMVNPGQHDIRLFYGLVLYRLDTLSEAQRELELVQKSNAAPALKAEALTYLREIKKKNRLTTLTGGLSAGAEYDSNRNASPTSQTRLFLDSPLELTGASRRQDDTAFLFSGNAELRRAVGAQKKHQVFGSLSYFRADQDRVKSVNLQAYSFKLGGAYKANRAELKPTLTYDRVLLDRDLFLLNTGGSLRLEQKISKAGDYWLELKYVYQNHLSIPAVTSNPERRGGLYGFAAGAGHVLGPVTKLDGEVNFSAKRAEKAYNSYNGAAVGLRHSWLLGKGAFLLSSAYVGNDVYRGEDSVISRRKRRDATFRGGLLAGLPVAAIHRKLSKLKDLNLSLNLEHYRSNSTIRNYTYINNKAALLVGYRWGVGL
jgi:TolB-like protein